MQPINNDRKASMLWRNFWVLGLTVMRFWSESPVKTAQFTHPVIFSFKQFVSGVKGQRKLSSLHIHFFCFFVFVAVHFLIELLHLKNSGENPGSNPSYVVSSLLTWWDAEQFAILVNFTSDLSFVQRVLALFVERTYKMSSWMLHYVHHIGSCVCNMLFNAPDSFVPRAGPCLVQFWMFLGNPCFTGVRIAPRGKYLCFRACAVAFMSLGVYF